MPATLRRTLSLHFLLVAILPATIFGLVAIGLLHKHLRAGIYERNRQLSAEIAANADQFLAEVEHSLKTVAGIIASGRVVRDGGIDDLLETVVRESSWLESIYLLDSRRHVRNLGFDERDGLRRDDYRDFDFSNHALFRQYPVIDRPVWSDSFVSLMTGEPAVTLVIPVGDGMLFGNISLRSLSQHLTRFAMDSLDSCAIIDHLGTLVASSNPDLTAQRVNFSDHPAVGRTLHGDGETVLVRQGDREVLESTAPIRHTGWVAWVGVDMGEKMVPVDHVRNLLAWILVAALLMASGVALLDAKRLMMPLSVLSGQAGQTGSGNYDFRLPPSGFVEIDGLAASLQAMSHAVRDREQLLLDSEQRFRQLVNSIDGVVWELDIPSGRYLFVSERSEQMFGYASSLWQSDPGFWACHVAAEDAERVVIRGRHSLALNEMRNLEYRFIAADGRPVWVRDLVTIIWDEHEPVRLLGVMIDISDRKRVEEELESYRASLEELVAQRTRELQAAQDELVRKERLAILGQLTATVSHEIRNPLGTVANSLYMFREALGSDCLGRVERPLALAERSVERCDGIIGELLDFTRRRTPQFEPLRIDDWLGEVLDEMIWPDGVRCCRRLESGTVVQGDSESLRRAVINVVNNALQAMEGKPAAEHLLDVVTRRQDDRCEIVVSDSGEGIPEELMDRIFEPLFSTKNFGVGLGVPIIRNIMTDHGGGVEYRSRVGEGTTVTLWLPLPAFAPNGDV